MGQIRYTEFQTLPAGTAKSNQGMSFSLATALLPLLEELSARRWTCPYFEVSFDISWITWVLTSNNWRLLPEPLLSRCPPIHLEAPSQAHLDTFARRQGARRALSEGAIDCVCAALEQAIAEGYKPDLRAVTRMVDRAITLESRPILQ